jgi:hypothetical protein
LSDSFNRPISDNIQQNESYFSHDSNILPSNESYFSHNADAERKIAMKPSKEPITLPYESLGYMNWRENIDNAGGPTQPPTANAGSFLGSTKNSTDTIHRVDISPSHPRYDEVIKKTVDNATPVPKVGANKRRSDQQP